MDNLFRKAAEQYPLKTEGADWQKVLAGLQADAMPVAEEKEKKKRRFLWLFLLVPLGLLWAVYYKGDNQPGQPATFIKENTKPGGNDSQKSDFISDKKSFSGQGGSDDTASELSSGESTSNRKAITVNEDKTLVESAIKEKTYQTSELANHSAGSAFLKNKKADLSYQQPLSANSINLADSTINNQAGSNKNNFSDTQPEVLSNRIDVDKTDKQGNTDQGVGGAAQAKNDSATFANSKADSAANNNNSNTNKSKLIKAKPRIQPGFYAGLLGNFDVSTIKLQRINKTGYGLQVLIGYRFSNRLSIESGLAGTVKNYYSKGKYFDKKNTGIPDIVNIYYTNGYCKMFEVPLHVKYDLTTTKKSNLFITAGFSSYFMKKENYSYRGDFRGRVYDTTRYYNNSGANWFSLADVSIGYETQLGRQSSLRIEPYIKVPLQGIGIANLPIASMGISAGFIRKF